MAYSPFPNTFISTANSTTANLAGAAVFTGTSEDVSAYAEARVSVFSSHVSATNGLSLQQSSDGTNWDFVDVFTVAATNGQVYSVPVYAQFFRLVYTNGATLTTSLRIETVYHGVRTKPSAVRPQDARSNEIDVEESAAYLMGFNGTTWDRVRTTGAGVMSVSAAVTSTIPGVAATSLGKAEDAVHASGDTGVQMLGVRNDNAATSLTSATGDYSPVATDTNGAVFTRERPATTTAVTSVAASATSVTLLALNAARRGATIYNDSSALLYLKLGATASTTSFTVKMAAESYYEVPTGYSGVIDALWASATGSARISEIS